MFVTPSALCNVHTVPSSDSRVELKELHDFIANLIHDRSILPLLL